MDLASVGGDDPTAFGRETPCVLYAIHGSDRLRRRGKRGVLRVDDDLGEQGDDLTPGPRVRELSLEQVADHPFDLGTEDVERLGANVAVRLALECEQADLRSITVHDHQSARIGEVREHLGGGAHVLALRLGIERLPASEERVAAECRDNQHGVFGQHCVVTSRRVHAQGCHSGRRRS